MESLLTPEELAAYLRISPATLLEWIEDKGLPCVRFSQRTIRFDPSAVREWLRIQAVDDEKQLGEGGGR